MMNRSDRSDRDASRTAQAETDINVPLTKQEFVQLANFRYMVRMLARHTELAARKSGITPQQYQLLLMIKGQPDRDWASISEIAERLQVRHNAVIGLVNRAEAQQLVRREYDAYPEDRRVVRVSVTAHGEAIISAMAKALRKEREQVISAARVFGQSPSTQPLIDEREPAQL